MPVPLPRHVCVCVCRQLRRACLTVGRPHNVRHRIRAGRKTIGLSSARTRAKVENSDISCGAALCESESFSCNQPCWIAQRCSLSLSLTWLKIIMSVMCACVCTSATTMMTTRDSIFQICCVQITASPNAGAYPLFCMYAAAARELNNRPAICLVAI